MRGTKRPHRGRQTAHPHRPNRAEFRYAGLDGIERRTVLHFSPAPQRLESNRATFEIELGPGEQTSLFVTCRCEEGEREPRSATSFSLTATRVGHAAPRPLVSPRSRRPTVCSTRSSCRATSDVYTLITRTDLGPYPYAGIPWFSTVFGRDGIITAMLMLWMDPSIARGVLRTLAATQATEFDPKSDAQPGKILHERRHGEMANLGEVPFRRYYGTVDATPLFVMLAGMYFERTGDRETMSEIWPNIEAALRWIDEYGDRDGDGFVEYYRETDSGLANQGWKDSYDAIFHADGALAEGPIALCEVQGYVYAAKRSIAWWRPGSAVASSR